MTTLTATGTHVMPRVNLLPPEIEERRRFRRVQAGLGAVVIAAAGVVGALYLDASTSASRAQEDLDGARAENLQLQQTMTRYAEVPLVEAQVHAAQAQLGQAMGQEVRWSRYLNDLGLTIPAHVWVTGLTITQTLDGTAATGTAGAPGTSTAAATGTPGIGQVQFTGTAFAHDDVAKWLEALARQQGYADPYFSTAQKEPLGTREVVTFSSTVTVTEDALSRRYTSKAGQ